LIAMDGCPFAGLEDHAPDPDPVVLEQHLGGNVAQLAIGQAAVGHRPRSFFERCSQIKGSIGGETEDVSARLGYILNEALRPGRGIRAFVDSAARSSIV